MQPAKRSVQEFDKLVNTESTRVGKLLGTLLKKRHPLLNPETSNFSVSFNDLLEWNLWPNFIGIYGKTVNVCGILA